MTYALRLTDNYSGTFTIQCDADNAQQAVENTHALYKDEINPLEDVYILEVHQVKGDCFTASVDLMVEGVNSPLGELFLVHAEVLGYGPIKGKRFAHAFCEDQLFVYDFSCGKNKIVPKGIYYATGDVRWMDPDKYRCYSLAEMEQKLIEQDHYGPWDIKTEI